MPPGFYDERRLKIQIKKSSIAPRCRIGSGLFLAFPGFPEAHMRLLQEMFFACPYCFAIGWTRIINHQVPPGVLPLNYDC